MSTDWNLMNLPILFRIGLDLCQWPSFKSHWICTRLKPAKHLQIKSVPFSKLTNLFSFSITIGSPYAVIPLLDDVTSNSGVRQCRILFKLFFIVLFFCLDLEEFVRIDQGVCQKLSRCTCRIASVRLCEDFCFNCYMYPERLQKCFFLYLHIHVHKTCTCKYNIFIHNINWMF